MLICFYRKKKQIVTRYCVVADSPHKIFIGGLPNYLNEEQVCRLIGHNYIYNYIFYILYPYPLLIIIDAHRNIGAHVYSLIDAGDINLTSVGIIRRRKRVEKEMYAKEQYR